MKVSSVAVFNEDGKLLMGKRKGSGKWDLPGGKANEGESPEETALRELKEESGIEPEQVGYLGAGLPRPDMIVHAFKAIVPNDVKVKDDDPNCDGHEWFWVSAEDGLSDKFLNNLHAPKNVVLGLLGFMSRQPDPPPKEDLEEEDGLVAEEVELSKTELGVQITPNARYYEDLSTQSAIDRKVVVTENSRKRTVRLIKGGECLARLCGTIGEESGIVESIWVAPEYRSCGVPTVMRRAFARVTKAETQDPVDLHTAFWGKYIRGQNSIHPDPKVLASAPVIPEEIWRAALEPATIGSRPGSVAALFSRPDADSEYLGRAANFVLKGISNNTIHHSQRPFVLGALAKNPRLPSGSITSVADQLGPSGASHDRSWDAVKSEGMHALLTRRDISPEEFADLAIRHSSYSRMATDEMAKTDPARMDTFINKAIEERPDLIALNGLLRPEQITKLVNKTQGHGSVDYSLQTQPEDFTNESLKAIWDQNKTRKWPLQAISRIPKEEVKQYLLTGGRNLFTDTMGSFSSAAKHPGLTSEDIQEIADSKEGNFEPTLLFHPNLDEKRRQKLWEKAGIDNQGKVVSKMPAQYVDRFLSEPDIPLSDHRGALRELSQRSDLTPEFWSHQLSPGKNLERYSAINPSVLVLFHHMPNPVAGQVSRMLTEMGPITARQMPWQNAHDDVVRAVHGKFKLKDFYPDNSENAERLLGRFQELGLEQPKRIKVQVGINKIRQFRGLAEEAGGSINNRQLKEHGVDLGQHGLNHLLDAKGNLTVENVDKHLAAIPSEEWAHSETTWKGAQRHTRAQSRVFQLNMTPERRKEIDAMGLGPILDKINEGGHPANKRHGVGWVRYTEKPKDIHMDEIQSDIGSSLIHRLKQNSDRASRLGVPAEAVEQLNNAIWGGKHPSEVLHEAFLQHLRDSGKIGKKIHIWQAKSKAPLSDQDPNLPLPAHMQDTYQKQPKRMGYKEDVYGVGETQSNAKLQGAPTWSQTLKSEDTWESFLKSEGSDQSEWEESLRKYGGIVSAIERAPNVPEYIRKRVLGISDPQEDLRYFTALAQRSDTPKDSWMPIVEKFIQRGWEAKPLVSKIAGNRTLAHKMSEDDSQKIMNFMTKNGVWNSDFLSHAKMSRESLISTGRAISKEGALRSTELGALISNPTLESAGREELWNSLPSSDVKSEVLNSAHEPRVVNQFFQKLFEQHGHELDSKHVSIALKAAEWAGFSPATWTHMTEPNSALHRAVVANPDVLGDMLGALSVRGVVKNLKPAIAHFVDLEKNGKTSPGGTRWWNAIGPESLKMLADEKILPEVPHDEFFDQRLYEAGLRKYPNLAVRPGLNKLRQLRDTVDAKGGSINPKEHGINLGSMGLGRLLDNKGILHSGKLQEHIDNHPPMNYTYTHGTWQGAQRHSSEPSKVFQLNLSPEALKEIEHQGLREAYSKLLGADEPQEVRHPIHHYRGVGWVRYTEKPDGIHIDEIQTDFGHKLASTIKDHDRDEAYHERLPTHDEFQRLSHIFWQGKHPSQILHEAFLQHLRDRGDATGPEGKEIHVWALGPKMKSAGQKPNEPAPAHMQETYDKQPKQMGYGPDVYGALQTQSGNKAQGVNKDGTIGKAPTYSTRLSKFELDFLEWATHNEPLEKSMGKTLLSLAAATALHVMPDPTAPEKEPPPLPGESQGNLKNVTGAVPATGDRQTLAIRSPNWTPKGLDRDLLPIAHLESSFGSKLDHKPNKTDWDTAHGALGAKPSTGHWEYTQSKTLQNLYPGLQDQDAFTYRFKNDHNFYNNIANSHFGRLKREFAGDPEKAALAWRYGLTAVKEALDLEELDKEGYARKYAALKAKQVARAVATQPGLVPQAIDQQLGKNET
jgi:ADP-ribose pyrophosphatase YjhB (NUDIX family)